MRDIAESDWKRLGRLKPAALDRLCHRILTDLETVAAAGGRTNHERYLEIYRLIEERDEQIARIFNDLRRSNAVSRLAQMKQAELITEEEFAEFGEELRSRVAFMFDASS